jgi:hypothetical protein
MLGRAANQTQKQTFSRCVLHGNKMNKRGIAAPAYQNPHRHSPSKNAMKYHNHNIVSAFMTPQQRKFGDVVVRGPPPKDFAISGMANDTHELRFTIPDTTENNNLLDQIYWRTTELHDDVLSELRSYIKIHSFAEDTDHEIEILN